VGYASCTQEQRTRDYMATILIVIVLFIGIYLRSNYIKERDIEVDANAKTAAFLCAIIFTLLAGVTVVIGGLLWVIFNYLFYVIASIIFGYVTTWSIATVVGGNAKTGKQYIAIVSLLSLVIGMFIGAYSIVLDYKAGAAETSESQLRNIYSSSRIKLRTDILRTLAANPHTPSDILDALSMREGRDSKELTLKVIFSHDDRTILKRVAENPNTAVSTLREISKTNELLVLKSPVIPADLLEKAMKYNDQYTKRTIAGHSNTPIKILETLSYDERGYVRIGVALNPNTPISVLERLAKDEDSIVKNFAQKRIEKWEAMK
jgi:hypothetical protein